MVRVFIAIDMPEEIRLKMNEVQDRLRACAAKMTFVDPSNTHMTLKFIGEVNLETLEKIRGSFAALGFDPFPVEISGVSLNPKKRPRIVWAEGEDGGCGARIQEKIDEIVSPFGIEKESRPFRPHVTLARIKKYDPSLQRAVHDVEGVSFGRFTVDRIYLKESTLTPVGPVYTILDEVKG
jgi:2'-5' RNA ligase